MVWVEKELATVTLRVNAVATPPPPSGSMDAAFQALAPGSSADFAIPSWGNWGAILTQTTRWHFDPVARTAWLWGQDAGYGSLIRYTLATGLAERVYYAPIADWGGISGGRAYDSTCLDNDGAFYLMTPDGQLRRFSGSYFDDIGTPQAAASTHYGLGFHLNLYGPGAHGFIAVRGSFIRHMPKAGGVWTNISNGSGTSGTNYASAVYAESLSRMTVTQGSAGVSRFQINPGTTPTRSQVSPGLPASCACTAGATTARLVPTPSSMAILENANSAGQVWRLSSTSGAFELQTGVTHPLQLTDGNWAVMYSSVHNAYAALRQQGSGVSCKLWRPPAGF